MKSDRTVSCIRRSLPGLSLVLFGLASAAACSGTDDDVGASSGTNAGVPSPSASGGDPVEIAMNLAVDRPALKHLGVDRASSLRIHESKVLRLTREDGMGPVLDAELAASAAGRSEVWAIEDREIALTMEPLVAADVSAQVTEDGRVVYRDVFGTADVIQSLEPNALHQTIVLEDRASLNYLSWKLGTGTRELRPTVLDDGAIVLVDGDDVGRLKVSVVTLVDASGEERKIPISIVDSHASLYIDTRNVSFPAVADFSVSAPMPGEQFAVAPVQIKARMLVLLDTSGSMIWRFTNTTGLGADGDNRAVFCDNNLFSGPDTFHCNDNVPCSVANGGRPYWQLPNPTTDPSRMYAAKEAITNVVSAHSGLLDFGLERFAANGGCPNAITFLMEQNDLTRKDLEPYIGSSGRVSEVLTKKRGLTLPMIKGLHKGLRIPYESLIH
jgi:hypothetical protein